MLPYASCCIYGVCIYVEFSKQSCYTFRIPGLNLLFRTRFSVANLT